MKKFSVTLLILLIASAGVAFAKTTTIDPTKLKSSEVERYFLPQTWGIAFSTTQTAYTATFYVYPTLASNPSLGSDPLTIRCNDFDLILAPGSSFSCPVKSNGSLSANDLNANYARNGLDYSMMITY